MSDGVMVAVEGGVGRLRLDRPRALNALTTAMCAAMLDALARWQGDAAIELVMIDHAGGRGFCAGGDIRMLAASGAGDGAEARAFFRTEYRLNHRLFTYPKPTLAVLDGVTMGGGVGIALPCRYRVATENTRFAMPETAIGLFPDVGGGWYLSRLPGQVGRYLALTGARLDGAECVALGLATHLVPADRIDAVKAAVIECPANAVAILEEAAIAPGDAAILAHREAIGRLFAAERLEDVVAALDADGSAFAHAALAMLATRSPQAMKVSLRLLVDGAGRADFADEMRVEYAVASRVVALPDFAEGVRAVIVDKDNAPRWRPPSIEAVDDRAIDALFAPLPASDEWTPAV